MDRRAWFGSGVALVAALSASAAILNARPVPERYELPVTDAKLSPRIASPHLVANPAVLKLAARTGVSTAHSFAVSYTGSGGHPEVSTSGAVFAGQPGVVAHGGGRFTITLHTIDALRIGLYSGSVSVRMCTDIPCTTPIPGAATTIQYRVNVGQGPVEEWGTFQRDARHSGYVPATINPADIRFAWRWRKSNNGVLTGINAVVTSPGRVYVSEDSYHHQIASLYALSESNGAQIWKQDFVNYPGLNPPAVEKGRVFVATTGHSQTFLWSFDASDGTPRSQSSFPSQWPSVLAPTIVDGVAYTNGGYYGGGIYAYAATDGMPLWSATSGDDDMTTPAVGDGRVYHYDGARLRIYDAFNGTALQTIGDPNVTQNGGYSYHGAPMLGSPDHVIAFSNSSSSGRASSEVEHYGTRRLVNFSPASGTVRWTTSKAYKTHPAVAKGVVYAGANNPKSFDAIDEATGQVLWSWVPGTDETAFHRNVVVTDNLVFVSTNKAVHAISLATRTPVWSYPVPGTVSISGNGTLYLIPGARESTGELLAFKVF
jgi:outer membrane protein assembly factor BamB